MSNSSPPILDYSVTQALPWRQVLRVTLAVLVILAGAAGGFVTGWFAQPKRHHAMAFVQVGVYSFDPLQADTLPPGPNQWEKLKQAQIVAIDEDLLSDVLTQLPQGTVSELRQIQRDLSIQSVPNTSLIRLEYFDRDPQQAVAILNAIIAAIGKIDQQKLGESLGADWTLGPTTIAAPPRTAPSRKSLWPAWLGALLGMAGAASLVMTY